MGVWSSIKSGVWKTTKIGLWTSAAVAGVAIIGSWLGGKREEAALDSRAELRQQQMAAMNSVSQQAFQPQLGAETLMGMQPVLNGEHGSRILAGRGQGGARGIDTSNPAINIGEPVQTMGV